jgi:hypothetical protein
MYHADDFEHFSVDTNTCRRDQQLNSEICIGVGTIWKVLHRFSSCVQVLSPYHNPTRPLHLLQAFLGRLPVHDVPDGLEVFGLAVLVVEAISR